MRLRVAQGFPDRFEGSLGAAPALGFEYTDGVSCLRSYFAQHHADSLFETSVMSKHFIALICWRIMVERECAVRPAPTKQQVREWAESSVDDFMKAFVRTR
jgi:hypothetical protein